MHQVDLEELIHGCRGPRAKSYIREAVDCYKVGAYRASIIMTWIAVVYDIIDKLRELGLGGDAQATAKVKEFETINSKRDVEAALSFERSILDLAQSQFEFLTSQEAFELSRLQDDRNRCAHPNLIREEDAYRPTAELARLHLRNAVELVLERPPVQGKAALDFLQHEVDSQYFPIDQNTARDALLRSPIARAKRNLIKEFLFGAITSCLKEQLDAHKIRQRLAAISAVCQIHPNVSEEILRAGIDAVFARLEDRLLGQAIYVLSNLQFLVPWLSEPTRRKLKDFVSSMPDDQCSIILGYALSLEEFSLEAQLRIQKTDTETLKTVVGTLTTGGRPILPALVDRAIVLYGESVSFDIANGRADDLIRPLLNACTHLQLGRIIQAYSNGQVSGSFRFKKVLEEIKSLDRIPLADFDRIMKECGAANDFPEFLYLQDQSVAQ